MEMERIKSNDERWEKNSSSEAEEEEEEEALSLCDLPVNLTSQVDQLREEVHKALVIEEDFDFGSRGRNCLLTESEMCAADEVFFQGQILPLRLSVSSDTALLPGGFSTRSDSIEHRSNSGGFSSSLNSSRSSSGRSDRQSSNKSIIRNQFHSHPSPKPQIRRGNVRSQNKKSTLWDFFRVGLVHTPEIELQDLKFRTKNQGGCIKSFGSISSNSTNSSNNNGDYAYKKKQRFFTHDGGFFSGCKCSPNAVETVSSRIVILKKNDGEGDQTVEAMMQNLKIKKGQLQRRKQSMSRHRTFEWLKELSFDGELRET